METAKDLGQQLQILFSATFFSTIALWIASKRGFFKSVKENVNGSISFWQFIGAFLIFFGVSALLIPFLVGFGAVLIGIPISDFLLMPLKGWWNIVSIVASVSAVLIYIAYLPERAQQAISRQMRSGGIPKVLHDFAIGASTWLIGFPLVALIGALISVVVLFFYPIMPIDQVAVKYLKTTMAYPRIFLVTTFLLIFIVPIIEEILFRGFLQTWLRQYLGVYQSIFLSSLIFAAFHFSPEQGVANFELLASLFILALFLGYLYERQQSLIASIALHITFNTFSVIMLISM